MRHPSVLPTFLASLLLVACDGGESSTDAGPTSDASSPDAGMGPDTLRRLDPDVIPRRYALELRIDPSLERFEGVAEIEIDLPRAQTSIELHALDLDVTEARVSSTTDGAAQVARYEVVDPVEGFARLTFDQAVGPGPVRARIVYGAPFGPHGTGLFRVRAGEDDYAFTHMQPFGARRAFPCFDEPSFKAPLEVRLVIPRGMVGIANGAEESSIERDDGMQEVRFAPTEPLPTYLVAFAVGPLEIVEVEPLPPNEVRSRPLPLRAVAARGRGHRLAHALRTTPAIIEGFERYFEMPYPYAKIDLVAVPGWFGAMENAGAITAYDSLVLIDDDDATFTRATFAYLMSHEVAHHWFGNLVTLSWWDDLWLNEAFATWAQVRGVELAGLELAADQVEMLDARTALHADCLSTSRRIRQPIATSGDVHGAFDAITYQKGARLLAMFEHWLGREAFRQRVARYLREHAGGHATSADFLAALGEGHPELVAAFEGFLDRPGIPHLDIASRCDASGAALTIRQRRDVPIGSSASSEGAWRVPFCARFGEAEGVREHCAWVEGPESVVTLDRCPSWLMPNARGAGYYRFSLDAASADALAASTASLDAQEIVMFADAVRADLDAGRLDFATAMDRLAPLASSPVWLAAEAPMPLLERAIEHAGADDARRRAQALYRAPLATLGWVERPEDSAADRVHRAAIVGFLAHVARDPEVRAEAARLGRAYVGFGGDGAIHMDVVSPDLADLVVEVAAEEGGAAFGEHLVARLATTEDPQARQALVAGLAGSGDFVRTRLLTLALGGSLALPEALAVLSKQLGRHRHAAGAWDWLRTNLPLLEAQGLGGAMIATLPTIVGTMCRAEERQSVEDAFRRVARTTPGGERQLASSLERIALCEAWVEAHGADVRAYFAD
jgi:alanyl aminopeptidase